MNNIEKYKKLNSDLELYQKENTNLPQYIKNIQEQVKLKFAKNGIPKKGTENYLYTDVSAVLSEEYNQEFENQHQEFDVNAKFKCTVPTLNTYTFFLQNGWYCKDNVKIEQQLPKGITVCNIKDAISKHPQLIENKINTLVSKQENSLADLNTLLMQDGLFIHISKSAILDKPIQIINLLHGDKNLIAQPRNLIIADENAVAKIIMCDHTLSSKLFLSNVVTEIFLKQNANIDFYNLQNQHNNSQQLTSLYISQQKNSNTHTNTLTLNGGLVRNNVYVTLEQENANCELFGLSLIDDKQHVDNFTMIDHAVPNCNSTEMYKNVLDDDATGAFSGKILVRKDAQKTQAFQSNKNLLLTNTAHFNTKPQLEIYADDVKCSHGATVGQINEEALFYLRARGIGIKEAKKMMLFAFANEVIEQIKVPALEQQYANLIEKRLNGELKYCKECFEQCK